MPEINNTTTYQGQVRWYDNEKSYGFIYIIKNKDPIVIEDSDSQVPEIPDQVFVHFSNIKCNSGTKSLQAGEHVIFELDKCKPPKEGVHAINVRAPYGKLLVDFYAENNIKTSSTVGSSSHNQYNSSNLINTIIAKNISEELGKYLSGKGGSKGKGKNKS